MRTLKDFTREVQDQEKLIASKLRAFRSKVGEESQKLVDITLKHEEKQQAEVKKYEDAKAEEKRIKEEAEKERVSAINQYIQDFKKESSDYIQTMTLDSEVPVWIELLETYDAGNYEEFRPLYDVAREEAVSRYDTRIKELQQQKEQQLENLRLREIQQIKDKRIKTLQPYLMFIRDLDSLLDINDSSFDKELTSLKNQMLEHQKQEQEKAEQQRKAEELASEERKKREEAEEKLKKMQWEKEQQELQVRTKERISQLVNDLQLKPDHTGNNYGNELVFIELEEIETLSVDDWNVFFEEKRVFISENNKPVEEPDEIEEVDFERNLPSFLMEDELGFVRTSKNVGVDVTDEWDAWLNENGIEL